MNEPLLKVEGLSIHAGDIHLVNKLGFELYSGKILGIVGESGSGKSLSSLAIMGLLPPNLNTEGKIYFKDIDLLKTPEKAFQKIRGKQISMIFQEPMSALNPSMKCGKQVAEILQNHTTDSNNIIKEKVIQLFKKVQLPRPQEIYNSYPHQISGGQKQRVMIAMALACKPDLLIADEPTTALDVTVQSEILNLLKDLQKEYGMAILFITHDLGVVKQIADDVLVMYRGEKLEYSNASQIFNAPQDPYTKGLLACRPTAATNYKRLPLVADFIKNPDWKAANIQLKESRQSKKGKPLLEVNDLKKYFSESNSFFNAKDEVVKAVDGVSFQINEGETMGLVGESGCGKTTLGRILSGLEKADRGEIFYKGKDISRLNAEEWKKLHREIQIIFQDPYSSLNPRIKVGVAISEVLRVHKLVKISELRSATEELLEKVGLNKEHYNRYPHEFSGGQRQRIGIARALALQPKFIICDESVSALDVSVQAQILNLLNDLKDDFGFTYLFISHDLAVVKYISDRIMVMRNGLVVESGDAEELYNHPKETYTQKLINSVPAL